MGPNMRSCNSWSAATGMPTDLEHIATFTTALTTLHQEKSIETDGSVLSLYVIASTPDFNTKPLIYRWNEEGRCQSVRDMTKGSVEGPKFEKLHCIQIHNMFFLNISLVMFWQTKCRSGERGNRFSYWIDWMIRTLGLPLQQKKIYCGAYETGVSTCVKNI